MTLVEVLAQADALMPNAFATGDKLRWLNAAEREVHILRMTHGDLEEDFVPVTPESPSDMPMLAPEEFSDVYLLYIQAQMDYLNGEAVRYNNTMTRYLERMGAFRNHLNRQRPETGKHFRYF